MLLYFQIEKVFYYNSEEEAPVKITIEDVARLSGVSISTVSRVINGNYPVKHETKQRVLSAINELDFSPNSLARGLVQKRTHTLGVLVPSITNLFFPEVISGIQDAMEPNGYKVILCDTSGDDTREKEHIKILLERRVDGIISVDPHTANIKFYENLCSSIPLVLVNAHNKGIRCNFVLSEQSSGTSDALNYLISLGHTNIGFVRGFKSYSYDLKEDTYKKVLLENNIAVLPENIITIKKGNSIRTVDFAREVLLERLQSPNRPTAIFACNDWMAVGTLHASQKLGISVPEELSVIGYDNTLISEITMPKLTTVDQDMHKLGIESASMLEHIMKNSSKEVEKIYIPSHVVYRESCAKKPDI